MTEQQLTDQLVQLIGTSRGVPVAKMLEALTKNNVELVPYLRWLYSTRGIQGMRKNLLTGIPLYAKESLNETASLPQHIVNCGKLFSDLCDKSIESERSLELLDQMCQGHVIYFLFAGIGRSLSRYRKEAKEYAGIFPAAVLALPSPYCELGKALLNDSAE